MLELKGIYKTFNAGTVNEKRAIDNLNLTLENGDFVTIIGGKTGTTKGAGNCLILLTKDSFGNPYISIIMGAGSKPLLYQDMTSMLSKI